MYHSITFGDGTLDSKGHFTGKNTWDDWYLIPSSRPTVAQAPVQTTYVDIPGKADGPIDLTEYLTGAPVYGQRSGSFEFIVDNDHEYWETLRARIASYLHGKTMKMVLEDDPGYYYEGTFSLSDWKSESWNSKITINYALGPYKYRIKTGDPWLWDPFNFDRDRTDQMSVNTGWL